jgi:hypothetical protein
MDSAGLLAVVDSSSIVVAVIVGGFAFAGLVLQGRQRREDKERDWARQDELLKRADVAVATAEATSSMQREGIAAQAQQAQQQQDQASEAAILLAANNENVAAVAEQTKQQLDAVLDGNKVIHTLVNQRMTASMESDLNANRRSLSALQRLVDADRAAGRTPSVDDVAAIAVATERVHDLEADLSDRMRQNNLANEQLEAMGPEAAAKITAAPPDKKPPKKS